MVQLGVHPTLLLESYLLEKPVTSQLYTPALLPREVLGKDPVTQFCGFAEGKGRKSIRHTCAVPASVDPQLGLEDVAFLGLLQVDPDELTPPTCLPCSAIEGARGAEEHRQDLMGYSGGLGRWSKPWGDHGVA